MGLWDDASSWAGNNPLSAAAGGAGLLDMLGGAYSRYKYGQQMDQLRRQSMDPNAWRAFYNPMSDAASQQILRNLNANNASMGVSDGQFGQQRVADALAKIEQPRIQGAMGTYQQALSNQAQGIRQPYGGGTMGGILQQLMILQKLKEGSTSPTQGGQPQQNPYGAALGMQGPFMGYKAQPQDEMWSSFGQDQGYDPYSGGGQF